jgi:uncharacterized protein (DUF433 family)
MLHVGREGRRAMAEAVRRRSQPARVTCDPRVLSGMPCVGGTRVPADTIADYLAQGFSDEQIFADYPNLPVDGIEAVRRWLSEEKGTAPRG